MLQHNTSDSHLFLVELLLFVMEASLPLLVTIS